MRAPCFCALERRSTLTRTSASNARASVSAPSSSITASRAPDPVPVTSRRTPTPPPSEERNQWPPSGAAPSIDAGRTAHPSPCAEPALATNGGAHACDPRCVEVT
jgi:hypothetical protein